LQVQSVLVVGVISAMAGNHGGKRDGSGKKGYRSKDKRIHVVVPEEYAESVKAYLRWLDAQTYPEVRREPPDITKFLDQLPDNTDL
jgi:hypothetical protein